MVIGQPDPTKMIDFGALPLNDKGWAMTKPPSGWLDALKLVGDFSHTAFKFGIQKSMFVWWQIFYAATEKCVLPYYTLRYKQTQEGDYTRIGDAFSPILPVPMYPWQDGSSRRSLVTHPFKTFFKASLDAVVQAYVNCCQIRENAETHAGYEGDEEGYQHLFLGYGSFLETEIFKGLSYGNDRLIGTTGWSLPAYFNVKCLPMAKHVGLINSLIHEKKDEEATDFHPPFEGFAQQFAYWMCQQRGMDTPFPTGTDPISSKNALITQRISAFGSNVNWGNSWSEVTQTKPALTKRLVRYDTEDSNANPAKYYPVSPKLDWTLIQDLYIAIASLRWMYWTTKLEQNYAMFVTEGETVWDIDEISKYFPEESDEPFQWTDVDMEFTPSVTEPSTRMEMTDTAQYSHGRIPTDEYHPEPGGKAVVDFEFNMLPPWLDDDGLCQQYIEKFGIREDDDTTETQITEWEDQFSGLMRAYPVGEPYVVEHVWTKWTEFDYDEEYPGCYVRPVWPDYSREQTDRILDYGAATLMERHDNMWCGQALPFDGEWERTTYPDLLSWEGGLQAEDGEYLWVNSTAGVTESRMREITKERIEGIHGGKADLPQMMLDFTNIGAFQNIIGGCWHWLMTRDDRNWEYVVIYDKSKDHTREVIMPGDVTPTVFHLPVRFEARIDGVLQKVLWDLESSATSKVNLDGEYVFQRFEVSYSAEQWKRNWGEMYDPYYDSLEHTVRHMDRCFLRNKIQSTVMNITD